MSDLAGNELYLHKQNWQDLHDIRRKKKRDESKKARALYRGLGASINGTLSDSKVEKHTKTLADWITENGYTAISEAVKADYNGPFTIAVMRRNEVLIELK